MLKLKRFSGQSVHIGDEIVVKVLGVRRGGEGRLGIEAPADVKVFRKDDRRRAVKRAAGQRSSTPGRGTRAVA